MTDNEERAETARHFRRMARQYNEMAKAIEIELGLPHPDEDGEAVEMSVSGWPRKKPVAEGGNAGNT